MTNHPKNNQDKHTQIRPYVKVLLTTRVFPKIVVPQNWWSIMENPLKIDDLGVPFFFETSTRSSSNWIFVAPETWIPISWNRRLMQCAAARSPSSLPRAPCRPLMTICFFRCPGSSRSVGSVTWRILLLRKSFLSNKLDPDQLDIQDLVLGECWGYVPDHGYI